MSRFYDSSSDEEIEVEEHEDVVADASTTETKEIPVCDSQVRDDDDTENESKEEVPVVVDGEKDIDRALAAKEDGNAAFKNADYDLAIERYSDAIDLCPVENNTDLVSMVTHFYIIAFSHSVFYWNVYIISSNRQYF